MKRERLTKLAVLPAVGVVAGGTAATPALSPVVGAAPVGVQRALPLAEQAGSGTYESCAAYFGLGKDAGVMDVVEFDVSDEDGSDGFDHGVPADTAVALVITTDSGDEVVCAPVEITEEAWAAAMAQVGISPADGRSLPAWPAPGTTPTRRCRTRR